MATSAISSTTNANTAAMGTGTTAATSATSAQAASKAAAQKLVTQLSAGSGVDVNTLAQNLVDAERIPRQTAIQGKIDKNNARITGLSAVMFMLSDLRSKLAAMKDKSSLSSFTTASSSSALTAVAASGAAAGSHEVQVNRLATSKRVTSAGFASDSAPINGGQPFKISVSKPGVKTGSVDASRLSSATNGQLASIVGASLGDGRSNYGKLTLSLDGVSVEVSPSMGLESLSELAADLQAKLREGRPDFDALTVTEGPAGQLNFDAGFGHTVGSPTLVASSYDVHLDGLSFGSPPETYFREMTLDLGGGTPTVLSVPPLDEPATPASLAAAIGLQLNGSPGGRYSVVAAGSVSDFQLYLKDNLGGTLQSPSMIAENGTPEGIAVGQASSAKSLPGMETTAWVTGVGVGALGDFRSLSVRVDGDTYTVSPTQGLTSIAALAQDLQDKLGQVVSGVKVEADGSRLKITSEDGTRTITQAELTPTTGASFLGGVKFGSSPSVDDFKGFSVVIGGVKRTVIPSPTEATAEGLAASLQARIRETDPDVSVRAVPDGSGSFGLYLSSSSGRAITAPELQTNVIDLSVGSYEITLAGVARAINDKKLGLTAQVVNTGAANSPYKLLVSSETGTRQDFDISSNDNSGSGLGFDTNNPLTQARDAEIVVNGMTLTRGSNTVSDAIAGVTLSLKGTTTSAATLDVSLDTSPLKTKMTDLVAAYNDNWDLLNQVSDPKSSLGTYGATLVGESLVRTVKQQVRSMFQGNSSTPGTTVTSLWQMGIKVDEKGVMSFDANAFDATVRGNYADVVKSLTGNLDNQLDTSTDPAGFAGDAYKRLTRLIAPKEKNGLIDSASNNANTQNTKYQEDLTKLQTRMDALLVRYQKQLAAMDSLVGSTNSQKTSLKSSFDGMMSVYTNN